MNAAELEQQQQKAPTTIDLIIRWMPQTGQIQIAWPNIDDTIKMGMLEMAKASLIEMRTKNAINGGAGMILPVSSMPKIGH